MIEAIAVQLIIIAIFWFAKQYYYIIDGLFRTTCQRLSQYSFTSLYTRATASSKLIIRPMDVLEQACKEKGGSGAGEESFEK